MANGEKKEGFFKKALRDMAEDARMQHEVDKAEWEAVKAESRVNFEENRGSVTFEKAKQQARQGWNDAHISPSERQESMRIKCAAQIEQAEARKAAAGERYKKAKAEREHIAVRHAAKKADK